MSFERPYDSLVNVAHQTKDSPVELAQDLLLMAVLPNHIRVLEKISECLDAGDWHGAMGIGMISAITSLGTDLETAHTAGQTDLGSVQATHRQSLDDLDLAQRLIERNRADMPQPKYEHPSDGWDFVLPGAYTDAEREKAILILKNSVEGLIHGLREVKDTN